MNSHKHHIKLTSIMLILAITMAFSMQYSSSQPAGATISSNTTDTPTPPSAGSLATAGGSFTTLLLNVTSQTPRWKAYVGNITGQLTLQDSNDQAIYDWELASITGEVYASRNGSIVWESIECAARSTIEAEDAFLNISVTKIDSINNTFNDTIHKTLQVAGLEIANSTCPAIATYVGSAKQVADENADFQEILLQDGTQLIYATILEQDSAGYAAGKTFDFQIIMAENEFAGTPTTYYFYAEIG
ncbi:hypothetical protein ACFL1B_02345 [Nanoarchaeota archaeon]